MFLSESRCNVDQLLLLSGCRRKKDRKWDRTTENHLINLLLILRSNFFHAIILILEVHKTVCNSIADFLTII